MKELSIEEKAKRYDEAIKVAKSNYETIVQMDKECTFVKEGIVNTFHHMFPELKEESDDERIRKVIYGWIYTQPSQFFDNGFSKEEMLSWLEKQGEQKPAWSEEDENRFNNLIFLVECSKEGEATKQVFIKFINRLKSLRPQNTWKPSNEQMKALQWIIDGDNSENWSITINNLYNDLKKLKGCKED